MRALAILALILLPPVALASTDTNDTHTEAEHADHDDDHDGHDHDHDEDDHDEDHGDDHAEDSSDHLSEMDGVSVLHAWTNATDDDHVEVYMEIANASGSEIVLTGGDTEIGDTVRIMATPISGTSSEGQPIDAFPINDGTEIDMTPGGLYLLVEGVDTPLAKGDAFEMHLAISPLGEMEIVVEVEDENAVQHSHAGHAH